MARSDLEELQHWLTEETGYQSIQGTKPQTLAYGLTDPPVGLAAWMLEKFRSWSDCDGEIERCFTKDELLTAVMLYWATGAINSSFFEGRVRSGQLRAEQDELLELAYFSAEQARTLATPAWVPVVQADAFEHRQHASFQAASWQPPPERSEQASMAGHASICIHFDQLRRVRI
jgi:hypothetical protein